MSGKLKTQRLIDMNETNEKIVKEVINNVVTLKFLWGVTVEKLDQIIRMNVIENSGIPTLQAEMEHIIA